MLAFALLTKIELMNAHIQSLKKLRALCCIFAFVLMVAPHISAQQVKLPFRQGMPGYEVVAADSHGFVVYETSGRLHQKDSMLVFASHYDTDFKKLWASWLPFPKKGKLLPAKTASHFLFIASLSGNVFQVLRIDLRQGEYLAGDFLLPKGFSFENWEARGDFVWFSGMVRSNPVAFSGHLPSKGTRLLATGHDLLVRQVTALKYNPYADQLQAVLAVQAEKQQALVIRAYDEKQRVAQDVLLPPHPKWNMGKATMAFSRDGLFVSGGLRHKGNNSLKGLFWSKIDAGNQLRFMHYQVLKEIPNFYRYTEVEKNGQLAREKKAIKSNYQLKFDEVAITEGGFLVSIETYSQNYRSKNYAERETEIAYRDFQHGMNQRFVPMSPEQGTPPVSTSATDIIERRYRDLMVNQAISTGYAYAYSSILQIDENGALQDRQAFRWKGASTQHMLSSTNAGVQTSSHTLAYAAEGSLFSVSLEGNGQNIAATPLLDQPESPLEEVKVSGEKMADWIDNSRLVWGYFRKKRAEDNEMYFFVHRVD